MTNTVGGHTAAMTSHSRRTISPRPELLRALATLGDAIADGTGSRALASMHRSLMLDTLTRTLHHTDEGIFVITGDIPAMWLRDSSAQMRPWLALAHVDQVRKVLRDVVRMQWRLIVHDPRANAFTAPWRRRLPAGGAWHLLDNHVTAAHGRRRGDRWIWERKYELDSLALPVQLADDLWRATGDWTHLDAMVHRGARAIVELWALEQDHSRSDYRFTRRLSGESLPHDGRGAPVAVTGMTWQAFRPSDDRCQHGYNIPAQLTAASALRRIARWSEELWQDPDLANRARQLRTQLLDGIERHGLLDDGTWAYEVDGLGGVLAADDANLPSLLGLPLTADVALDDPRYLATRARLLSARNPWWHTGSAASGIGSPHTPGRRVWPIALAVQGLTATNRDESMALAQLLADTTAGTGRMHESFHADDPSNFSRAWFSWADMMFCELLQHLATPPL